MREVSSRPLKPEQPLSFCLLRVPFFLEPEYPTDESFAETNRERLIRKWGGKEAFEAQKRRHRLKERGQEVGIKHFNLDRQASSTLASHRLVQWVTKNYGVTVAEALYNDLNYRHFELGQKLNCSSMLVEAAAQAGVDAKAAAAFLSSSDGTAEIKAAQSLLRSLGINSIPTFIIGGETVLGGAAHSSEFVHVFREIEERGTSVTSALFADALGFPAAVLEQSIDL
mmetsp:Transcript_43569/g.95326  ORF Transcript_43569/g.95326 Transcript_43569/m.95326 type:complete len:226 (-) Transcript_43569:354-1031(-)